MRRRAWGSIAPRGPVVFRQVLHDALSEFAGDGVQLGIEPAARDVAFAALVEQAADRFELLDRIGVGPLLEHELG